MISRFSKDTPIANLKAALLQDGAIVIENVVSEAHVDRMTAELKPYLRFAPPDVDFLEVNFAGNKTDRAQGLITKVPTVVELVALPQFVELSESVLSRETKSWQGKKPISVRSTIQLSDTVALSVLPGEKAQDLHRDDLTYHVSHPGPETQVLYMIALSDFTEENGSTQIIPGSHLWDDERAPGAEEATSMRVSRGSCIVWLGATYHGAGANRSNGARTGVALVYSNAFLRQVENQYLAVPPTVARKLPPKVQKLIGYSMSEPMLGFWELQDPIVFLNGERGAETVIKGSTTT